MRRFVRLPEPEILQSNWERIGKQYSERRDKSPSYSFTWPQINAIRINHSILPLLKLQTEDHCSYCDKYPLYRKDDTIDHFRPKTDPAFYLIVCRWDNLFLACNHCQDAKKTQYEEALLRPDDKNYMFNRYFVYNYREHTIEINPLAVKEDQIKAEVTLRIFDFNHSALKKARQFSQTRYIKDDAPILDDYEFRFMYE